METISKYDPGFVKWKDDLAEIKREHANIRYEYDLENALILEGGDKIKGKQVPPFDERNVASPPSEMIEIINKYSSLSEDLLKLGMQRREYQLETPCTEQVIKICDDIDFDYRTKRLPCSK